MRGIHHTCPRPAIFAAVALTDNAHLVQCDAVRRSLRRGWETGTTQRDIPEGADGKVQMESVLDAFTILVADDSEDAVESLAMLLEFEGHDVVVAHDGHAALNAAERVRPHIAILDIGMPGATGYEVASRIRQAPWGQDMLLIAATGWGQDEDRRRALAAGFDHHLTKPMDATALVASFGPWLADVRAARKTD